ncbi:hypothetical protein F5Y17DRAFT_420466 [Xylariaceae sp. FL0594]|nr:hypothetical protein F5Y17DRAFT_420466 [Xylariaceae sp. FL0594]
MYTPTSSGALLVSENNNNNNNNNGQGFFSPLSAIPSSSSIPPASPNTPLALTFSGTLTGDPAAILRRSMNLFYRASTSFPSSPSPSSSSTNTGTDNNKNNKTPLIHLRISNGAYTARPVGHHRAIGPRTNLATFSTGYNESSSSYNTIGLHVLSIDPDDGDGGIIRLSSMLPNSSEWTDEEEEEEVTDLRPCKTLAKVAVNRAQRLYCLVNTGDEGEGEGEEGGGIRIMEWAWRGRPSSPDTYRNWEKVGVLDLGI